MTRIRLTPLLCAALAAAVSTAPAAEVTPPSTLDFLVDDPSDPDDDANAFIMSPSGRFRFSEFVFSPQATGMTPPGETDIRVGVEEDGNSATVIIEFLANNTATGPGAYELDLQYLAEVVDPNTGLAFQGHTLAIEGTTEGDGTIFVNEPLVGVVDGDDVLLSTTIGVPNQPDTLTDSVQFSPGQTMTVYDKDIAVSGGPDGGSSATLTRIEQTFQVIPEPSSLALLGLGVLGLGVTCRRLHRT